MNMLPIKSTNTDGTVRWTLNGKLHRENGPALEYANGYRAWYLHDKIIRDVRGVS